ncbi:MAG: pyruvate kinase [Candidatus Omnitrophota bacterium]|nr:pyruvate kinase [Candidatus Omnitrophota bacterium]
MVKTKIIATLGPASTSRSILRKMILSGLDVVRLNFSHGSHREHLGRIKLIRELNKKYRRHIKILGDLEGFRIRIGKLSKPLELKKGAQVLFSLSGGGKNTIPFDYPGEIKDIKTGWFIYIDDGNICLRAQRHTRGCLEAKVIIGGIVKEHKGINIPEADLSFGDISKKDKQDIEFTVENRLDYLAQSFVRGKGDILNIRKLTKLALPSLKIIAKVENRKAIKNIDEIINVSDGVMVARGDLGVSLPIYEVPVLQKEIIRKCSRQGKFSITATQMLESMTENLRPTRAEVSDVANAIFDGSDYVMLSAETAVGRHPEAAVKMMNQIIKYTENYLCVGQQ